MAYASNHNSLYMSHPIIPKSQIEQLLMAWLTSHEFSESTLKRYRCSMNHLLTFMENNEFHSYDESTRELFLQHLRRDVRLSEYTKERDRLFVAVLDDIIAGIPYRRHNVFQDCNTKSLGRSGPIVYAFLDDMRKQRLSKHTIATYRSTVVSFATRLQVDESSFETMDRQNIMNFVSSCQNTSAFRLMHLRKFLAYLHQNEITREDFSKLFQGIRAIRHEKLPSYYSKEEVRQLELSIERSSSVGKRDYAIILLATRLGLRSSDIRNLTFQNLDWDRCEIHLVQYKTKRDITLPLLSDVGDAIIDYARNGRPKTDYKQIFLTDSRPIRPLEGPSCSSIVSRRMSLAGINYKGRHHGMHSLRHSLATALMNKGETLHVIAETLGHSSSESTMYYLGVDITSLLECSLSVPPVDDAFYTQKGGALYV